MMLGSVWEVTYAPRISAPSGADQRRIIPTNPFGQRTFDRGIEGAWV